MHGFQSRACGAEVTLQARGWIYLAQFLNPSLTHSAVASSGRLLSGAEQVRAPPGMAGGGEGIGSGSLGWRWERLCSR